MSMSNGPAPYIGSPFENLTLSNPNCNNDSCKAFYEGHQLSQKLTSYAHQFDYGHYVTWYYLAFIGLLTFVFCFRRLNQYRFKNGSSRIEPYPRSAKNRLVAFWRYFAYRRWPGSISDRLGLPSMGIIAMGLLFVLFCLLLTFWKRPYYRQHRGYGSPPLAVRTGLMAVALTPLIFALSGKANLVTMLTGIGHEKLNIVHRWVGWIIFGLSVAHTIPFIVAPLKDGGYKALHKQYYKAGGFEYTGTPPLAILFGILVLSIPYLRHRAYELFYHVHFWLAVTYLGLMFWHAGNEGDSWAYLWASLAIWLMTIVLRTFYFTKPLNAVSSRWFVGSPLIMRRFPDNMTRLELLAPAGFHWTPGQHVYLRLPQLNLFDNHPFTIATSDCSSHNTNMQQSIHLYVRSYAGFTRRLRHHAESRPDPHLEAWLEGPYGGHHRDVTTEYDNMILVAGGGGISAVLPWLEDFVYKIEAGCRMKTRTVRLFWSIKHRESVAWISEALEHLNLETHKLLIKVFVHITQDDVDSQVAKSTAVDDLKLVEGTTASEKGSQSESDFGELGIELRAGRMDLTQLCNNLPEGSSTVIIGCGPESLKVDLQNACAFDQKRVFRGDLAEVALQTETFGW